jgi:hypothetical protein
MESGDNLPGPSAPSEFEEQERAARMRAKNLPQVTNIRQLTCADVDALNALIDLDFNPAADPFKYNDFDLIRANTHTQEHLISQDSIIGDLELNGKSYKFIHSWPGDEPCGVLYTEDLKFVFGLHWSMDRGVDAWSDWYLESVNEYFLDDDGQEDSTMEIPSSWLLAPLDTPFGRDAVASAPAVL